MHLADVQQIKHGAQHTDTSADHGAPFILQSVHAQAISGLRTQKSIAKPVQAFAGNEAHRPPCRGEYISHCACRARRSIRHVPGAGPEGPNGFVQHCFGSNFGSTEGINGEFTVGEIPLRPRDAPYPERRYRLRRVLLAHDELCGAASDVNHQSALIRLRQQSRDPLIDKPGLL
ncbi:hypothetical protein D3C71_1421680 [compost metagenome]